MRNFFVVLVVCAGVGAQAQPVLDHHGREVFGEAMKHAAALRALQVDIKLSSKITVGDQVQDAAMDATLQMRGNHDLRLHVRSTQSEAELISNGDKRYAYLVSEKKYMEEKVRETRSDLIGMMSGGIMRLGSIWLGKFITNDPAATQELQTVEVVSEDAQGTHLLLKYAKFDLDLWLLPSLLPDKLHMELQKSYSTKVESTVKRGAVVDFVFSNWRENPTIADAVFSFTPPDGVTQETRYADTSGQGENPLIGKPAPAIALDMIDGTKFDLAAHKGKEVVLIDFWATWCGPCRMSLPVIVDVAKEYKAKGVAFYTVDQRESKEKVQGFLEKNKMDFPVAIDTTGSVSMSYLASSIPNTVIVDRKGVTRFVHKGFAPNEREEIAHELDLLLAEK